MNPISNAIVTYTPGSGYTATIPGYSNQIRWGEEFLAEARAKAAANAEKVQGTVSAPRKELTKADIAELASKYDPKNMSQEEYDAFLEDMVEREFLSRDEIGRLGYEGAIVCGTIDPNETGDFLGGGIVYRADINKLPGRNPLALSYSLSDANGDILNWVMVQSIMEPFSAASEAQLNFAKGTSDAYKALYNVLEAIQAKRSR